MLELARRSSVPIYCLRSAGGRTRTISVSIRQASPSTLAATSRSTISCAPTYPASGPWGIATGGAPSPIPPGTISKSCSEPSRQRSAARQRSNYCLRALHRSPAGTRRYDRGRGPQVRPTGADRDHANGGRKPSVRERRNKGLHEDPGRQGNETDPRGVAAGAFGGRGHSLHPRYHVCQGAVHGPAAGGAHPPDSLGVHSNDVGRSPAVVMSEQAGTI